MAKAGAVPYHCSTLAPAPAIRRFQIDCWNDDHDLRRQYGGEAFETPGALRTAAKAAWKAGDRRAFTYLAERLLAKGALGDAAPRLARSYLSVERFEDALSLLKPGKDHAADDVDHWYDLARALLGAGRFAEALQAAERARALAPADPGPVGLEPALRQILAVLDGGRADLTWADVGGVLEDLLAFRRPGEAAEVLFAFLEPPDPVPAEARDQLFDLAIRVMRDTAVRRPGILKRLKALYQGDDRRMIALALGVVRSEGDHPPADMPSGDNTIREGLALVCEAAGKPKSAIQELAVATRDAPSMAGRRELLRAVGEQVIRELKPRIQTRETRRIFDVFPFNGERTMLHLKLNEMADWVDRFVIVESAVTFTGRAKPLRYEAMKEEFRAFWPKISYVVVDSFPDHISQAWAREFYQRDNALRGLEDAADRDLVLVTDVDEIIDRRTVEGFDGEVAKLGYETFRSFFNYRLAVGQKGQKRNGAVVRAGHLRSHGLSYVRCGLSSFHKHSVIHSAGWHFTSISDAAGIADKVASYSHEEHAHLGEDHFRKVLASIRGGKAEPGWERVELDDRFPDYLRRRRTELAQFIL